MGRKSQERMTGLTFEERIESIEQEIIDQWIQKEVMEDVMFLVWKFQEQEAISHRGFVKILRLLIGRL